MAQRPEESKKTALDHVVDAVSAGLQSAPFTGGLGRYLDAYYPNQVKRTLENFRDTLRSHADEIESVQCDVDRLGALTSQILLEIPKTPSNDKREAFQAILLNYAEGKSIEDNKLDMFLQVLAAMTELEIRILRLAADPEGEARKRELIPAGAISSVSWLDEIKIEDIISGTSSVVSRWAFTNLCQRGLLTPLQTVGVPNADQPVTLPHLKLSPIGEEFLSWIERR